MENIFDLLIQQNELRFIVMEIIIKSLQEIEKSCAEAMRGTEIEENIKVIVTDINLMGNHKK